MGGRGSGSHIRWSSHLTTSEVRRIDIRYMKKCGHLSPNTGGTLNWTSNGHPSGSIYFCVYSQELKLSYRYRDNDDVWHPLEQSVLFDRTPCHFGGHRLWFKCPRCSRRIGILYGVQKLFLCRHCYQLPYTSQNQSYINRLIEQKHVLGKRIFAHYEMGEGWGKKKGMHQKTFDRIHARYDRFERVLNNFIITKFNGNSDLN